jgi:hypothetical protein
MSVLSYCDHVRPRHGRKKIKAAQHDLKRQLKEVRGRLSTFLDPNVSDADRRMLAEVFVTEHNALLLCEDRRYKHAIGLLQEQQARNTCIAARALERLLREGALVA